MQVINLTDVLISYQYFSSKGGTKITITHIMIKAVGMMLYEAPDVNGRISFGKVILYFIGNIIINTSSFHMTMLMLLVLLTLMEERFLMNYTSIIIIN